MKEFNTKLWNEWYLPKKELVDNIVNSISYFTINDQNFVITDTFNPFTNINDLIIFLYLKLDSGEYTVWTPIDVNAGKVGFIHLRLNERKESYFPYLESDT